MHDKIKQLYDWRLKETTIPVKNRIKSPEDIYENFRYYFENRIRECFVVFSLSSSGYVMGFEEISSGTSKTCLCEPKEVFLSAFAFNSDRIVIAHNHPSGALIPSNEDINITKNIKKSGEILGVQLLDHIIFSRDGFYSLNSNGKM